MTMMDVTLAADAMWITVGFVVLRDLATRQFSQALPATTGAIWAVATVMTMGSLGVVMQGWHLYDTLPDFCTLLGGASTVASGVIILHRHAKVTHAVQG
ncbi:MAG: hypothetical protein WCS20_02465 [Alphaproteobacteria bacterium]|jgi:hypothetical protein